MLNIQSPDRFVSRHIGIDESALAKMLETIGVSSLDTLIDQTIPSTIRLQKPLNIPAPLSEYEYLKHIREIAAQNKVLRSYIGLGYHNTITPSPILRNILENPAWYTQYTPYQAEIAQGRLESLLNYQTMISDLTGLPVANASLLDEATAAAEAMALLHVSKNKGQKEPTHNTFLVANNVLPQTLDLLQTRAEPLGIRLIVAAPNDFHQLDGVFGVLLQYPDVNGSIDDYTSLCDTLHQHNVLVAVAADLLSLAILTPPGEWGADVVFGNSQRFGVPMGFGGPHAAYFAAKEEYLRSMPGRIIGVSEDAKGNRALRMALQTREQHIKREKATSNICTAQALLANMAAMYAVYHGPQGIRHIAEKIHAMTRLLHFELHRLGFVNTNAYYFDTLALTPPAGVSTDQIQKIALQAGFNFRYTAQQVFIALDETVFLTDLADVLDVFRTVINQPKLAQRASEYESWERLANEMVYQVPTALVRTSSYLTHSVFNSYHSESLLMRYIKHLENKDLSLVHSMISLGSCTMKLNAATELIPISWPEFGQLHPFIPEDQWAGYRHIFSELEKWLCNITGFDACSLQPNSGAQGEYAGLLTIRAYHQANGNGHRNVALIPSSAHGTNPASAVMAGMKVVVSKCDERGNIDLDDLRQKAEQYKNELSCLMVTYPSTHGVFETQIKEICTLIHAYGGLVYMDGANMNAQVGLTSPAEIGADVCHLNLHKTFAIPHGGGGPGVGPICVNTKLAPFLPSHTLVATGGSKGIRAVSAAPWGSASILLISYAYIRMLGANGLTDATKYAILNANYIKARLEGPYQVLYAGEKGRAAHELIIDLRPFKKIGVEAEDVAKRLMDYGFHAPTLSFPVPGTIMIEPTESEDKAELDRFCEALLQIRQEIDEIALGHADPQNNVLKNAPHTSAVVTANVWEYPYTREKAAFPLAWIKGRKFWASVSRVNNTVGDRNVVCTCPPIEEYATYLA